MNELSCSKGTRGTLVVLEKKEEELKEHSKFRNEKEGQRRAITPSVLAPSMSFRSFGSGAFDMGLDVR